ATALRGFEVGDLLIVSRTLRTAETLAARVDGRAMRMGHLEHELAEADVVVTCTGADGVVLNVDVVERAMAARPETRPLFILDVAVPRDVDPRVAKLAGVTLADLDVLAPVVQHAAASDDVREARRIVDAELAAYVAARRASGVAPTVVALRDKAAQMVATELHRLDRRLPDLDEAARQEIASTVRRVVDKVLHAPTVRVQELANTAGPESYPEALRRLFDLDPAAPAAIASPDPTEPADQP
ncbi:MAG TPA: glutamyl-tRNA reductase, partial [Acidothermaceae bacterium]